MTLEFILADYRNPAHAAAVVEATDAYARDAMGGGKPLSDEVKARMIPGLLAQPNCFSVLVFADGKTAGVANCMVGFSTFAARPLVNIHDLSVLPAYRGRGIGEKLIAEVEKIARDRGCGKMTLEVRPDNPARRLYERVGFKDGFAPFMFLNKPL